MNKQDEQQARPRWAQWLLDHPAWFYVCFVAILLLITFFATGYSKDKGVQENEVVVDSCVKIDEVDVEAYQDELDRIAWSVGMVESRMTMDADDGHGHYGPMQISIAMMKHANRLCGFEMFTFDDLFTWSGSLAIMGVMMNAYNPDLDLRTACRIWNKGGGERYYQKVKAYYDAYEERS